MMQPGSSGGRNGTTSKFENADQEISAVSVLDDDGASGVGAAAAAAVSVALARSWAAAASQKQAAMVERTTSGSLKPGRAGFRLVAAVSNTDLARLGGSNKRSTFDHEVCAFFAYLAAVQAYSTAFLIIDRIACHAEVISGCDLLLEGLICCSTRGPSSCLNGVFLSALQRADCKQGYAS